MSQCMHYTGSAQTVLGGGNTKLVVEVVLPTVNNTREVVRTKRLVPTTVGRTLHY